MYPWHLPSMSPEPRAYPGARRPPPTSATSTSATSKPESFPVQFRKTRMCKFHQMGKCTRGKACTHAHSEEELRHTPNLARTCMCRTLLQTGVCEDSSCTYAHQLSELKSTNTFFKTRVCWFFKETGHCKLGDKCRYAHSVDEIRENEKGAVAETFREQEAHNRIVDSTRRPRLPPGYSSPPTQPRGHKGWDAYRDNRTYADYPAAYPGPYPGPPGMHPGHLPYPLSSEHRADYPAFPGPSPGPYPMSPSPYPSRPYPRRVPAQPWWYPAADSVPYPSSTRNSEPGTPPGLSQAWMQGDQPTGSDEPELPYEGSRMSIKNTFLEVQAVHEHLPRVAASVPHDLWNIGYDAAVEEAQKLVSFVEDPFENQLEDCPLEDSPERISLARPPVVPKKDSSLARPPPPKTDRLMAPGLSRAWCVHNTFIEEPVAKSPSVSMLHAYSVPNYMNHLAQDTDDSEESFKNCSE